MVSSAEHSRPEKEESPKVQTYVSLATPLELTN